MYLLRKPASQQLQAILVAEFGLMAVGGAQVALVAQVAAGQTAQRGDKAFLKNGEVVEVCLHCRLSGGLLMTLCYPLEPVGRNRFKLPVQGQFRATEEIKRTCLWRLHEGLITVETEMQGESSWVGAMSAP
ncbi:hypothetical protein AK812_SmicGene45305 [Symbiodinium microadriaticum]|uniref:Uncharacterized protein n=1 Tax=Symbiodinium microadriaticum TaxID=2951 RepID=A0A1Q9BWB8_SYMMI|nr:hypothetical protein AK812_SmicGene45305 [Symbiodinium microadriaticum]